jgi:hypothetical protein
MRNAVFLFLLLFLALPIHLWGLTCTQTFTPANVGTSPFPGSNVNTAVQNGNANTVLCFATGSYGAIDLFSANPSGIVTIQPAPSAAATGPAFNLNGVHNLTITGFNGTSSASIAIVRAGTSDSTNITFSNNNSGTANIYVALNTGTNTNILIQNNTVINHNAPGQAALLADRNTGCPNGVVFKNNHVSGTTISDGMGTKGADCGTQFIGNEIEGILQSVCGGADHCDGFQDNGGSVNEVLDGNYFHNVSNCGLANDGTANLTYKNNVCVVKIGDSSFAMQWTGNGITFTHNTVIAPGLGTNIGNTAFGQSTNFIETDNIYNGGNFVLNPGQTIGGTGWLSDYNLCVGGCQGAHSISGAATFVGGASPTTYAGFGLTNGSLGHLAANDGTDMGIQLTPGPPLVQLSANSLTFQPQQLSTTSTSQTVTVTNSGGSTLNQTSIIKSGTNAGDFAFGAMTCPTGAGTLAAGSSCTIVVTFTPTAAGSRTATITITDNASDSPQTISLTGTGGIPVASVNPGSINFGGQNTGTTSGGTAVTLQNTGTNVLSLTAISIGGTNASNFGQSNNCPVGSTLAVGAQCTVTVTFTPSAIGARSGTLSFTDNAAGSPQSVSLSGTGTTPGATLTPASLTYGSQAVGTSSTTQALTVTSTGTGPLTINSITITGTNPGDYSQSNNCPISPSTLAAAATCTINVTFTPLAAGARVAAVSVTDNAAGSPRSSSLNGTATSSQAGSVLNGNATMTGNVILQ